MPKASYLQYILYATVCIVSIFVALICMWWFTQKPYTKEDFIVPSPYLVMVGMTSSGGVFYADVDVPMNPKWINTALSGVGDIAGAYGQLYTVPSGGGTVSYASYTSSTQTAFTSTQRLTTISVDDDGGLVGCNGLTGTNVHSISSPTAASTNLAGTGSISGSVSGGRWYEIGVDKNIYYHASRAVGPGVPANPSGTAAGSWAQVSFDNVVCAIQTDGTLWCADTNIGAAGINWKKQGSKKFSQISLRGGRLAGIGTDGIAYYSNSYDSPSWTAIPMSEYTSAGVKQTTSLSLSKIILMYPLLDARRKRFATTDCNDDEQKIGVYCYQACSSGRAAVGTQCPYRQLQTPAIAVCPTGATYLNGSCYNPCPSGMSPTPDGKGCILTGDTRKRTATPNPSGSGGYVASQYKGCPEVVSARYVRIRPTTLISNNKLCLARVSVKAKDNTEYTVSSTGSRTRTVATKNDDPANGTCVGSPIGQGGCGTFATYLSGTKYDSDPDGGKASRASKVYWEVDLGAVVPIKSIQITGCNYVPASSSTATAGTGISEPNQDQITGMRVELLYDRNLPTTTPLVSRTLGPQTMQTLTFNYVTIAPNAPERCYDDCPPVNGVPSVMDKSQMICISASGGMTARAISSPLPLPAPVCGPPKTADGGALYIPVNNAATGSAMTVRNWVTDPTNPTRVVSCDGLPGSILVPLTMTTSYPAASGIGDPFIIRLTKPNSSLYTGPDIPYKCVKPDNSFCSSHGPNFILANTISANPNTINYFVCLDSTSASYTDFWDSYRVEVAGLLVGRQVWRYTYREKPITHNMKRGDWASVRNDLKVPLIPDNASYIQDPLLIPSQCRCLNQNGTVNPNAYLYNNQCIRCATSSDTFYPNGQLAKSYTWSAESPKSWLSLYVASTTGILGSQADPQQKPYKNIKDAQTACEINPNCNGITRTIDTAGDTIYTLRGGKILLPTNPGSSQVATYTAAGDTTIFKTNDSSWIKEGRGSGTTIPAGNLGVGAEFSPLNIPRAFADDYINPTPGPTVPSQWFSGTSSDLTTAFSNTMLQVAANWTSWQNSVQNTNTYYRYNGVTRSLNNSSIPRANNAIDTGICVGPCDPEHTIHDPIQMVYDTAGNGGSGTYYLFGTTCHDGTQVQVPAPSIPAGYTAAQGNQCPTGFAMNSSGTCVEVCSSEQKDTGTDCVPPSQARTFSLPSFRCPTGLVPLDTVCVHGCPSSMTEDSGFCLPKLQPAELPSTINCTKVPYTSTNILVSGSSVSVSANKWLCDSPDDVSALLDGPEGGGSVYLGPDDTVCTADDPTTGMYFCQSVDDARNGVEGAERTDYKTTCDNLTKAYIDLSNNLTIILSAQTTATNSSAQIAAIEITLRSVIQEMCGSTGSGGSSCTNLWTYLNALGTNIGSGTGAVSGILNPIQVAVQSQTKLKAMLVDSKCPPV